MDDTFRPNAHQYMLQKCNVCTLFYLSYPIYATFFKSRSVLNSSTTHYITHVCHRHAQLPFSARSKQSTCALWLIFQTPYMLTLWILRSLLCPYTPHTWPRDTTSMSNSFAVHIPSMQLVSFIFIFQTPCMRTVWTLESMLAPYITRTCVV